MYTCSRASLWKTKSKVHSLADAHTGHWQGRKVFTISFITLSVIFKSDLRNCFKRRRSTWAMIKWLFCAGVFNNKMYSGCFHVDHDEVTLELAIEFSSSADHWRGQLIVFVEMLFGFRRRNTPILPFEIFCKVNFQKNFLDWNQKTLNRWWRIVGARCDNILKSRNIIFVACHTSQKSRIKLKRNIYNFNHLFNTI